MELKILQYNVREGFRNTKAPYSLEKERLVAAKKLVKKEKPDILVLNESYFNQAYLGEGVDDLVIDYAKEFGFKHVINVRCEQGLNPYSGSTLLSKFPIVETVDKTNNEIVFFSNKVLIGKTIINLDVVHLQVIPLVSAKKQAELLKQRIPKIKKNHLVTGDFNSLSPLDNYDEKALYNNHQVFSKKGKSTVTELLKRTAIKEMLKKGFIDTYKEVNKEFNYTIPTDLLSKNKTTGIRIDYLFSSKEFKVKSSEIIKNKITEMASDHYPTITYLEL